MKRITLILILLLLFSTVFILNACSKSGSKKSSVKGEIKVSSVIDGDTFMIGGKKKVRLLGIDAPDVPDEKTQRELAKQGKNLMEVRKQGRLARNFLKNLINKKEIKLEYDVQKEDKNGRALAYVYKLYCSKCKMNITPEAKEIYRFEGENVYLFLNAFMVQWGYAVPAGMPPNTKYDELFMKLYQEAKENERGLWKPPKQRRPWRK